MSGFEILSSGMNYDRQNKNHSGFHILQSGMDFCSISNLMLCYFICIRILSIKVRLEFECTMCISINRSDKSGLHSRRRPVAPSFHIRRCDGWTTTSVTATRSPTAPGPATATTRQILPIKSLGRTDNNQEKRQLRKQVISNPDSKIANSEVEDRESSKISIKTEKNKGKGNSKT